MARRRHCWRIINTGLLLTVTLLTGFTFAQPEVGVVDSYVQIRRELADVWAGPLQVDPLPKLIDDDYLDLEPGSLVTTDENGEGWLRLIGDDNRQCGWIYLFQDSELTTAACPKSSFLVGNSTCSREGTSVHNNKCKGNVVVETPTAEILLEGTWFSVTHLRDTGLSLVQMYEGQARVRPVLDIETRTLGPAETLAEGFFWFSAPGESSDPLAGLTSRQPHPLADLPLVVAALGIERWQVRIDARAGADRVDEAALAGAGRDDTAPLVTSLRVSPSLPRTADRVTIEASARDSDLDRIEIYVAGELARTCRTTRCEVTTGPFAEGEVRYEVVAVDLAGNAKTRSDTFSVRDGARDGADAADRVPPVITQVGITLRREGMDILAEARDSGSGIDRIEIYVGGRLAETCSDMVCTTSVASLDEVDVRAVDRAGNETTQTRNPEARREPAELALDLTLSPRSPTSDDRLTISAVLGETGAAVDHIDIFVNDELATTCEDAARCTVTVGPGLAGPTDYRAEAYDQAGNRVVERGSVEIESVSPADLTPPTVVELWVDDGGRSGGVVLAVEFSEPMDRASVRLRLDLPSSDDVGAAGRTVEASPEAWSSSDTVGTFRLDLGCDVGAPGRYTATFSGTDLAGNELINGERIIECGGSASGLD